MQSLYSFNTKSKNDRGYTVYDYDGEAAGEALAQAVCNTFLAVGDVMSANVIASSSHLVEGTHFDEDFSNQFDRFSWHIISSPDVYANFPTPEARAAFKKRIVDLDLSSVLGPVDEITISIQEQHDPNWRKKAQAASASSRMSPASADHPVVSGKSLTMFRNAVSDDLVLRDISDAFGGAGIPLGSWEGEVSGDRRTRFMNYIASIDQAKASDVARLISALSHLLVVINSKSESAGRIAPLVVSMREDGFSWDGSSLLPIVANGTDAHPTMAQVDIVEEIVEFLRAVPRGLREIERTHRYSQRDPLPMNDEYDLQDFVRAVLRMRFPRATFEESVNKVAGLGGRVDFLIGSFNVFVELKFLKAATDWKPIVSQPVVYERAALLA